MRTTETRFSSGITRYEPKRRWARPALLVLFAALVLWLMSGGVFGADPSFAEDGPSFAKATEGAAMAAGEAMAAEGEVAWKAWQQGIVIGFSFAAIIAGMWCAARKTKRDDEAAMERFRAGTGRDLASPAPWPEDPLSAPFSGIDAESMIRITDALQDRTESAADWVRCARATICRHEQEDMLRMALRDLEPVNACLPELKLALEKQMGGQVL